VKALQFSHFFYFLHLLLCILPLLCMTVFVGHWIFSRWRFLPQLFSKIAALRKGYVDVEGTNNNSKDGNMLVDCSYDHV